LVFPDANDFGLKYQEEVTKDLKKTESTYFGEISDIKNVDQLENALKKIYTSNVGVEFSHITNTEEADWLYRNYERSMLENLAPSEKLNIHQLLVQTEV
jgi:2-oxoglutarate dehydrogenase complex dehydrogenase (E1) component-like enzyme